MKLLASLFATTYALNRRQQNEVINTLQAVKENIGVSSIATAIEVVQNAWRDASPTALSDDAAEQFITSTFGESHGFRNACEGDNCQTGTLQLEALFGYGCWCFFGRIDSALGRGPPVDLYDATCQKLALCYRCIFVDAENEGDDECDPFQTEFAATISLTDILGGGGGASSNATTSCRTENTENCSWRTCSCAMTMITSFFNLSFDANNVYDDNLKHSEGFDYNLECPQQGKSLDRQCCGFYPQRRTFDRKESRECCHDITIYNPLRHICCDDGTHVGLGHNC